MVKAVIDDFNYINGVRFVYSIRLFARQPLLLKDAECRYTSIKAAAVKIVWHLVDKGSPNTKGIVATKRRKSGVQYSK